MSNSFSSLIKKKDIATVKVEDLPNAGAGEKKKLAFAGLKKATGKSVSPPPETPKPSSTSTSTETTGKVKLGLSVKPKPKTAVQNKVQPSLEPAKKVDDSGVFEPADSAKEFQHPDQPETIKEEEIKKLRDNLDLLKNNLDDKELVTNSIARIMSHLKAHSFLTGMMMPEDCGLMVKALRESYGSVIAKKQERQTKKAKRTASQEEIENLLDGVEFSV